jgi:hypothetical protein
MDWGKERREKTVSMQKREGQSGPDKQQIQNRIAELCVFLLPGMNCSHELEEQMLGPSHSLLRPLPPPHILSSLFPTGRDEWNKQCLFSLFLGKHQAAPALQGSRIHQFFGDSYRESAPKWRLVCMLKWGFITIPISPSKCWDSGSPAVRTFLTKTKRLTEKEGVLAFQLARSSRASTSWQVSPLRRQWNAS